MPKDGSAIPWPVWAAVTLLTAAIGAYAVLHKPAPPEPTPPHQVTSVTPNGRANVESPDYDPGVPIDDWDSRVRYNDGGGWKTDADYNLLKSTQHYTGNPGSTATLEFNGTWIEVIHYREPGGTIMSVAVDGRPLNSIDCGSQSGKTEYRLTEKFTELGRGVHEIVLTNTGRPQDGRPPRVFGDYTINVDGFRVSRRDN